MYSSTGIFNPIQAQIMSQTLGGQFGSLNGFTMGVMNSSSFFYMGNSMGLDIKLQELQIQANPITDASITVTGNKIKQGNICCFILTTVLGGMLIFPLFLMCFGWWKKMVNAGFSIPLATYQKLQVLILCPTVKYIAITVNDNTFDQPKAECLYNMLSRSTLRSFIFSNIASPHDYDSNQWSKFEDRMKPIKQLSLTSEIRWYSKIVL